MPSQELARILLNKGAGITHDEIFSLKLNNLINKGLRVVTICYDGTGRSYNVANYLNSVGIPTVRLIRGISQFKDDKHLLESLPYLGALLNNVPNISIIQTREEVSRNMFFISRIQRPIISKDSQSAFETIKKMEQ